MEREQGSYPDVDTWGALCLVKSLHTKDTVKERIIHHIYNRKSATADNFK